MSLINMAVQESDDEALEAMKNPYGYGLCIRLNPKQCEALGILPENCFGEKQPLSIGVERNIIEGADKKTEEEINQKEEEINQKKEEMNKTEEEEIKRKQQLVD